MKARLTRFYAKYNEDKLEEVDATLEKYQFFRTAVAAWLSVEGIRFVVPEVLPTDEFADASHPLTEGYERLAKRLIADPVFKTWLSQ